MVTSVTSLGRNGLYDWVIQRASAVVVALYVFVMLGYLIFTPDLTYLQWREFMGSLGMKVFNLITIVSILAHAWVGLWTVSTDYIKPMPIRFVFQAVCGIAAFAYFVWAVDIFWRI
jgi:succinate dehydrogenase / fumarate reductase membrane anchor subunit